MPSDDPTEQMSAVTPLDFRAVFDAAADGILVVAANGNIRQANREALRQFGYEPTELIGESIDALVPASLRRVHGSHRDHFNAHPRSRPMGIGMQLSGLRRDGTAFPIEISLSPHESDGEPLVICVVRDMTERSALRTFGIEAIKGAERERQRIARELHDDTAQLLSALMIRLKLLSREEDFEKRQEMSAEFRGLLHEAAEGVRRIARGLRPPALEDAGVVTALRGHLQGFLENTDVTWELHADGVDHLLGEDQKLVLYRVVQEAVSNAVRHGEASAIEVLIRIAEGAVDTTISDDGKGFHVEQVIGTSGLGLMGMRERALGVHGHLECESEIDAGTRIRLTLPLDMGDGIDG